MKYVLSHGLIGSTHAEGILAHSPRAARVQGDGHRELQPAEQKNKKKQKNICYNKCTNKYIPARPFLNPSDGKQRDSILGVVAAVHVSCPRLLHWPKANTLFR